MLIQLRGLEVGACAMFKHHAWCVDCGLLVWSEGAAGPITGCSALTTVKALCMLQVSHGVRVFCSLGAWAGAGCCFSLCAWQCKVRVAQQLIGMWSPRGGILSLTVTGALAAVSLLLHQWCSSQPTQVETSQRRSNPRLPVQYWRSSHSETLCSLHCFMSAATGRSGHYVSRFKFGQWPADVTGLPNEEEAYIILFDNYMKRCK